MAEIAHSIVRTRNESALVAAFPAARDNGFPNGSARQAAAAAFVDELYTSVVEPQRLAMALTCLARAFDAAEAWLVMHDASDDVHVVEQSLAASSRRLTEHGLARCLAEAIAGWPQVRLAGIRTGTLEAGTTTRNGAGHYLTVTSEVPGQSTLSLVVIRAVPFTESEREIALALAPDARRALQLRSRAKRTESVSDGLQIFENTSTALLVTRQRAVERSNAAASSLISAGRPISLAGGKLVFEDSRAQSAFESVSRADVQGRQNFAFVVEGTAGRAWIAQLSLARQTSQSPSSPAVIVALTPFRGASQTREAMLDGFTELTPTERAIFAAVVDGDDVTAIAAKMKRSVETVRWHVRNLFTKLGVNSQADLARLGALLLPI
jgi:DNA-binding CsgD family transcriptional regulator